MRPGIRRLKAEHDIFPADAHAHKLVNHFALGVVDLKPDFFVFDVYTFPAKKARNSPTSLEAFSKIIVFSEPLYSLNCKTVRTMVLSGL